MSKRLYRGNYPARSKAVREHAKSNPQTRCWRCGRTYAQAVLLWGRKGAAWQSGHVADGHPLSPLRPEHAYCNTAAGGKLGGARRRARSASPGPVSPNA